MGRIVVCSRPQDMAQAALALEALEPMDLLDLPRGRQRYALLTNAAGGIVDDLMIANLGDRFCLLEILTSFQAYAYHPNDFSRGIRID